MAGSGGGGGGLLLFAGASILALAGAAGAYLLLRAPVPSPSGPGGGPSLPVPVPGPGPGPPPPPPPAAPAVAATPEACLAFLREQGARVVPAPGTRVFAAVRENALDALASLPGGADAPEVLAAMNGDGDPSDWASDASIRLHAAAALLRAGRTDAAAAVRAFLGFEDFLDDSEACAEAATAATLVPPGEGAAWLKKLLAELPPYDGSPDCLARALRAAASVGGGVSPEFLKGILASEDFSGDSEVLGSAAGALARLGQASAAEGIFASALADEGDYSPDEFVAALGAPSNGAVLPWLRRAVASDDDFARAAAVRAMGVVGDPSTAADLAALLKDADPDVVREASIALCRRGDPTGLPGAREAAAAARDGELRTLAWRVLGDIGDAGAREAAARLLAVPAPEDATRGNALVERIWAARLLVRLGSAPDRK